MANSFGRTAAHRFTSESLKGRYQEQGVFAEPAGFYNHTSYMFARFDENQLKNIKPCQLQVYMANKAEMAPAIEGWSIDGAPASLSTLSAPNYTWSPENWVKDPKRGRFWKHGVDASLWTSLRPAGEEETYSELFGELPRFNLLSMEAKIDQELYDQISGNAATSSIPSDSYSSWIFGAVYSNNFQGACRIV